jgi:hypothetical protein
MQEISRRRPVLKNRVAPEVEERWSGGRSNSPPGARYGSPMN